MYLGSSVSQRAAAAAAAEQQQSRSNSCLACLSRAFSARRLRFFFTFCRQCCKSRESGKEEEFDPTSEQSDLKMISTGRVLLLCSYASYTGWLGALRS